LYNQACSKTCDIINPVSLVSGADNWLCDQAIQLHGAYGYTTDYEVERYYHDVRGWSMGGSTTQVCINRIVHEILKNLKGWETGRQGSWNAGKH